jgi:hypothetical protein
MVQMLSEDHARVSGVLRMRLESRHSGALNALQDLREMETLLGVSFDRLAADRELLSAEVEASKALINATREARDTARVGVSDEAAAMTLLLLNNEIRVMQERLLRIERELNVELPERQQTFLNELANIKRDQKQQSGAIALIASELSNLRATRLLQDTSRSLLPVTPRRSLIVLLSIVFGGVLSLVVALVLDAVKLLRGSPPA